MLYLPGMASILSLKSGNPKLCITSMLVTLKITFVSRGHSAHLDSGHVVGVLELEVPLESGDVDG